MTIYEGYRFVREALCCIYDPREAGNIAALVMEKITGLQRMDRLLHKDQHLPEVQNDRLTDYTASLLKHQPVQYVLGEAWFYNMRLYVNENVLIPRPETEELVEWVLKDEKERGKPQGTAGRPVILDIGTGSGCIAVALKKNMPESKVYAIDISDKALAVARKNAHDQQCEVQFLNVDILNSVLSNALPSFDVIVSNPPYIPVKDKTDIHKNVLDFEPHTALFVEDNNSLLFYSAIAAFAEQHLQPHGCIYTEIHEAAGEAVKHIFIQREFVHTVVRKDMQGKDRMVKAGKTN